MVSALKKIDHLFQQVCSNDTPGVALFVKQQDTSVLKAAYGICNLATMEAVTPDTCFNIASLTKQFTALGILLLENQKQLSLDQPLVEFFPGYCQPVGNNVTIRQLICHNSGLHDHYPYIDTSSIKHITDSNVLEVMQGMEELYFTPGSQYRYSNTAYCLLAKIVEQVSGVPYSDFLKQYIFGPAGMRSSFCWNKQTGNESIAMGYDKNFSSGTFYPSGPDQHPFFSTEGDGGIYTTINDYIQWMEALQNPAVFPEKVIAGSKTSFTTVDKDAGLLYGAGWFINSHQPACRYHCGSNGGYRSYCFSIPEAGYTLALFANRSDLPLEQLAFTVNEWLIPQHRPFISIEAFTS